MINITKELLNELIGEAYEEGYRDKFFNPESLLEDCWSLSDSRCVADTIEIASEQKRIANEHEIKSIDDLNKLISDATTAVDLMIKGVESIRNDRGLRPSQLPHYYDAAGKLLEYIREVRESVDHLIKSGVVKL